ncbi:hypothetical protein [Virgisporangium ochraceum]|uniref:Uncharacterized protein n=1 Tax=Virgisporangium ochraceum TaxID=65505 RepID=A0A8J4E9W9_9ACTN|nr:hypothetical protein [Virgisporangium ochraceum]GIJ66763.1 hypothetical protein Voc01_016800 [Virgisporangium ochraceum]
MTPVYIGLDAGHGTVAEAEHWLDDVLAATGLDLVDGVVACTHLVRTPWPHVAVSLAVPGPSVPDGLPGVPDPLARAAEVARAAHASGRSGRASHFPGRDRLTGTRTVADLLAASAIEAVVVLGAPPPRPETPVQTRDFVRPQWTDGRLTLVTTPAADGHLAPFEVPNPTPCCAQHA